MDVSRRRFITAGAAGAVGVAATLGRRGTALAPRPATSVPSPTATSPAPFPRNDPFTLGVASGDPWPDSVVLWTRLVSDHDDPNRPSLGDRPHEVAWQVASDPQLARVVRTGTAWARPDHGHSLRVVVDGLQPATDYWYRFRIGSWHSPTARTRTAPARGRPVRRLDVVAASCQSWTAGYYTAHRHLAAEQPDVVLFLGDYLYEYGITVSGDAARADETIPQHLAAETDTLSRYRAHYAWYKRDPDLQAAHHAAPWVATWDDHEVQNNYAAGVAGGRRPNDDFLTRRAAAYRAYWEHLPLRSPPPVGPAMRMHRRLDFGTLASVHVLDTRQHRTDQVGGDAWQGDSAERRSADRTMLGAEQQRWLDDGLAASTATWDVVAQQVIASRLDVDPGPGQRYNVDTWDGYPAAQRRLHEGLSAADNAVVLTGDLHAGYAFDLRHPADEAAARPLGVELAATSISSGGDGEDVSEHGRRFLAANPHLRYANQRRGYLRCRFTPDALTADFRVVPYVTGSADAPVHTDRSFVVEAGAPVLQDA